MKNFLRKLFGVHSEPLLSDWKFITPDLALVSREGLDHCVFPSLHFEFELAPMKKAQVPGQAEFLSQVRLASLRREAPPASWRGASDGTTKSFPSVRSSGIHRSITSAFAEATADDPLFISPARRPGPAKVGQEQSIRKPWPKTRPKPGQPTYISSPTRLVIAQLVLLLGLTCIAYWKQTANLIIGYHNQTVAMNLFHDLAMKRVNTKFPQVSFKQNLLTTQRSTPADNQARLPAPKIAGNGGQVLANIYPRPSFYRSRRRINTANWYNCQSVKI
jgi:hypothetical protein